MQTSTLALVLLATLIAGQADAADFGRRFGRQLTQENRIGDGAGNILDAVGLNAAGGAVAGVSDADDGDLTNDLAATGQDVGQLMLDTIPAAGNTVPGKRRLLQAGGGAAGGLPAVSDITGDVQGAVQEVEQLGQDTVSNLGGGAALPTTGRRLHQNAGTGAGCNSIFSDFDTSTGEGTENAENNVAGDINGAKPAGRRLHQNAGTGAGCDAIFSDFDTSTGEGTENAENNIASDLGGHPAAGGGTGRKL